MKPLGELFLERKQSRRLGVDIREASRKPQGRCHGSKSDSMNRGYVGGGKVLASYGEIVHASFTSSGPSRRR